MNRWMLFAATIATLVSGPAGARETYVYGPAPDWTRYKSLAEPAIRAQIATSKLADPSLWSIEWPNGYVQAGWRHKGSVDGYLSCGYLQPRVPSEVSVHRLNFAVVIDHDQVKTVDISTSERNGLVNVICGALVSQGRLPPANLMSMSSALTPESPIEPLGLTIRPMPDGAYIASIKPGSRAEQAGLKAGMVVTSVNGIPLASMGAAMLALFAGDAGGLSLETATGQHIRLPKAP